MYFKDQTELIIFFFLEILIINFTSVIKVLNSINMVIFV